MGKKNTRPSFQFHKGTIKTMPKRTRTVPLCHFNSIKVRLKRNGSTFNMSSDEFQFHKGTIKTGYKPGHPPVCSNFNSIKVRLKPIV